MPNFAITRQVIKVDYEGFRQFLLSEMKKHKISGIRELAKYLGVSHTTVGYFTSPIEGKTRVPSMEALEKIAEKLGMPLTAILMIVFPRLRATLSITDLSADEYRLIQALRSNDTPTALALMSERLRQAFGDNPDLAKNE